MSLKAIFGEKKSKKINALRTEFIFRRGIRPYGTVPVRPLWCILSVYRSIIVRTTGIASTSRASAGLGLDPLQYDGRTTPKNELDPLLERMLTPPTTDFHLIYLNMPKKHTTVRIFHQNDRFFKTFFFFLLLDLSTPSHGRLPTPPTPKLDPPTPRSTTPKRA